MNQTRRLFFHLLSFFSAFTFSNPSYASDFDTLDATLERLLTNGSILGAQALVGEGDQFLFEESFGVRSANDSEPINADTQFCIGSCSKPFASATLFVLAQNNQLSLDTPINRWLPQFAKPSIVGSDPPTRSPNLLELLAHRGGIYSQKLGMNRRQARWIRDFRLTLEDAVNGIAKEALINRPGTEYAYSGAGYCVLGRVAEVALGQSFETLFQQSIAEPLRLSRTTYFPNPEDPNIATGSVKGNPNPTTPHLSTPFHLPLIGGSLYSTARDTSRFARMILERGRFGDRTVLEPETYKNYLSLPFEGRAYGMGWSIREENDGPVEIFHTGSLASSRASLRINLDTGRYAIVFYTLNDPSVSVKTAQAVNRAIGAALKQ